MQFIPSKFQFIAEQYGDVLGLVENLTHSLILNKQEYLFLLQMVKISKEKLLYRSTRDGFRAQEFHRRCDGKARTITIIQNNLNFVFGGYTSSPWNSSNQWINDKNAFLFSLRKTGYSCCEKFMNNCPTYALYGASDYGPTFGRGHEIYISDQSNITNTSLRNCEPSYDFPKTAECKYFEQYKFAGPRNSWRTTEIEVYEIKD